ncbi:MAG TPA: hypothetical protein DCP92_19415 [Nitrospiraceae bacterium]|jgi:hypothetical protein|nr:hypothetical protein [Nitrospiraceae bacterium]
MPVGIRRHQRFVVEHLGISAKNLYAAEAELLNISMTGACVATSESLKFADKHLIKLHSKGMPFSLHCHVIWENSNSEMTIPSTKPVAGYTAGIRFSDTASDKMVMLKDFIRMSGSPNEQRLSDEYGSSALRFRVHANKKVLLYYPKSSHVKKISVGGMLMELDNRIQVEKRFPMALFLPNQDIPMKFQGRVACCLETPDTKSKRFDIGIEFLDITENDKSRLGTFLQTLSVIPLHKKLWRLFKKAPFFPQNPKQL